MKRVLILANEDTHVLHFRSELIVALVKNGNEVIVSIPKSNRKDEIIALGAKVVETNLSRHGKNPLKDLKLLKEYKLLIKEFKPNIVFSFTVKPNVYGGLACRKLKVPFVANITGLGVIGQKGLLQKITLWLCKKGLKDAKCVFFQNESNKEFFESKKIVKDNAVLLPGSGVNLEKYYYSEYPSDNVSNLLFVGRIVKDKGAYELASTAKHFLGDNRVRFTILGTCEYGFENPFENLPNVECKGYDKNVRAHVEDAHAIILPSYHEGMANVLLEGAASGRPVLASNIPGCKESFDEGVTGFGFNVKDAQDTIRAVEKFLSLSYEEKRQMGILGRKKMENQFDRNIVIGKYLEKLGEV